MFDKGNIRTQQLSRLQPQAAVQLRIWHWAQLLPSCGLLACACGWQPGQSSLQVSGRPWYQSANVLHPVRSEKLCSGLFCIAPALILTCCCCCCC